ncbi:MAG: hypothetical protein ACE5HD_00645 [Acidobacteriota bacterium]
MGRHHLLGFRMDGMFSRQDVLSLLERRQADDAIKVPFFWWLDFRGLIKRRRRWKRVAPGIHCFSHTALLKPGTRKLQILI